MGSQSRELFKDAVDFDYRPSPSRMCEFSMVVYFDAYSREHPTSELA